MPPATGKRNPRQGRADWLSGPLRLTGAFVAAAFLLLAALPPSARGAGETLYGALIMATNNDDERPPAVPLELRDQAANLESVFGYNEFRVVGQKHQPLTTGTEDWLVSGHRFFLKIDTKYPVMGGYALSLQLVKEKQVLVEADVKLSRERPLFIRGPFVGQGQLIILLMVQ